MLAKFNNLMKNLGPGLMYAGAAVGVSHLVGSTKAGAKYGFLLLLFIPLIHVIKYPFYKFGPQYTAVTGRNILHGYNALGKWALWTYIGMTLLTMCLIQAAVTIVTSSIAVQFFGWQIPAQYMPHLPAIIFLFIAGSILFFNKYSLLDKMMKFVIIILTITTVFAVSFVLFKAPSGFHAAGTPQFDFTLYGDAIFLAAFLGWMPAPMDVSVWHSVWSEECNKACGEKADLKKAMFDFKIGFIGTACLAICFLSLGALVMYGGGEAPSPKGAVFAGQLINMYTRALGSWAYPIIGIAALATMISTTLTCLDAYPRTLDKSFAILKGNGEASCTKTYRKFLFLALAGTTIIFLFFLKNMGQLVTLATVVAFISAPILATISYLVMTGPTVPEEQRPNKLMKNWSRFGILALTIFSIWYIWVGFIKDKEPAKVAIVEQAQPTVAKN